MLDTRGHIRQAPLQSLKVGDGMAKGFAFLRVAYGLVERALGDAEGLGADADPTAIERGHGDPKAFVDLTEDEIGRDATVLEKDLRGARGANAKLLLLGSRAQPGGVGGDQKGGDAFGLGYILIGQGIHQIESSFTAVGDPRLGPVQDEAVAVAPGLRTHVRRIRARGRLAQAVRADVFTLGE